MTINSVGSTEKPGFIGVTLVPYLSEGQTMSFLMEQMTALVSPFIVTGNVMYQFNKKATGWVVTLINNLGITKTNVTLEVYDNSFASAVMVELNSNIISGNIESIALTTILEEVLTSSTPSFSGNSFSTTVYPGQVQVYDIVISGSTSGAATATTGTTSTTGTPGVSQYIYDGTTSALDNGWEDYSYTAVSYSNTDSVYSGCSYSISVALNDYGAVYWHTPDQFTADTYSTLSFYINGGTSSDQPLNLLIYGSDTSGPNVIATLSLSAALVADTWVFESISISSAGLSSSTLISGFAIQFASSGTGNTIYIDSVLLSSSSGGGDSAAATMGGSTPTAPAGSTTGGTGTITGTGGGGCSALSYSISAESTWTSGAFWGFTITNSGSTAFTSIVLSITADGSISNLSQLTADGSDYSAELYPSLAADSTSGTFGFQVSGDPHTTPTITFTSCS